MASGLIIAFVVAVWAAYFVPLALRRYDEASKNASVETSGYLSRVISRPAAALATPVPVPESATETVDANPARTISRPAARRAARRRRRTLLTLLGATAIVVALAALSIIARYWVAAPVALVVAWLIACRVQVRGELGMPRLPAIHRATPAVAFEDEDTIVVSGQIEDVNPGRRNMMEDVALEEDALADQIVIAVPSVSTSGEALWDPLPVTLPTYVTKPRAGRTVRTIDFGQAGAWTSGHIEGEDVEMPHRQDDAGDQRHAVGH